MLWAIAVGLAILVIGMFYVSEQIVGLYKEIDQLRADVKSVRASQS